MHVGMCLAQYENFSVTPKQGEFAKSLHPLPTAPALRAAPQQLLSPGEATLRQCKLGELALARNRLATGYVFTLGSFCLPY